MARVVSLPRDDIVSASTVSCTVCELPAESTFKVEGMDCREGVALLERGFKNLPGLEDFPAALLGSALTARRAWNALGAWSLDINVLMMIAAGGAIVLGQWSEAAAVIFLFALAQTLEARTLDRARNAVRALMDLTPAEALVRDDSGERVVSVV